MKLKFPRIKKWKKIEDIDRLQKAWDQKYAAKGHQTQTESDFIDATNEIKYRGTGVERFEKFKKVDERKQTIANVYGKKPTEGSFKYSELSPEEDVVLGQARILGDKVQTRHIKKAQAAYANIARKSGTKFVVSAGKIKPVIVRTKPGFGKNEEFYTNYTKAMIQARKLNQPSQILTSTKIVDSKFIGPRLPKYKGIGKPTSGEELKVKYDKVAIRAITSGKGAEAKFIKNSIT